MANAYRTTPAQIDRLVKHPRISAKFAIEKGLWEGRKVGVFYLHMRGNRRRRNEYRIAYGTLVLTPNAPERMDQIGVRDQSGEVHVIHVNRDVDIYDMTRTKPAEQ